MQRLPQKTKTKLENVQGEERDCWPVRIVAQYLGVTDRTLYNWEQKGWIPEATIYGPPVFGNPGRFYTRRQVGHLKTTRDLIAAKKAGDITPSQFLWRLRQKHTKLKGAWDNGCELTFRGNLD